MHFTSNFLFFLIFSGIFTLLVLLGNIFRLFRNNLKDSEGRTIPDCYLMPENSTALDFAFRLHTDLGNNFIKAIDVRTKRVIGKEYKIKNRDMIEIVTKK